MRARPARLQRLEHERGDPEPARAARVRDFFHAHHAVAGGAPRAIGRGLLLELALEVRARRRRLFLRGERRGETQRGDRDGYLGHNHPIIPPVRNP